MKYKYLWLILLLGILIVVLMFQRNYYNSTAVRQQSDIRSSTNSDDATVRDAIQSDSTP